MCELLISNFPALFCSVFVYTFAHTSMYIGLELYLKLKGDDDSISLVGGGKTEVGFGSLMDCHLKIFPLV